MKQRKKNDTDNRFVLFGVKEWQSGRDKLARKWEPKLKLDDGLVKNEIRRALMLINLSKFLYIFKASLRIYHFETFSKHHK